MFSAISLHWRGNPLKTLGTVVNLIGHTHTKAGLTIQADLDRGSYPKGNKPDREALENLRVSGICDGSIAFYLEQR